VPVDANALQHTGRHRVQHPPLMNVTAPAKLGISGRCTADTMTQLHQPASTTQTRCVLLLQASTWWRLVNTRPAAKHRRALPPPAAQKLDTQHEKTHVLEEKKHCQLLEESVYPGLGAADSPTLAVVWPNLLECCSSPGSVEQQDVKVQDQQCGCSGTAQDREAH